MLNFFFHLEFSAVPASTMNGSTLLPLIALSILATCAVGFKKKYNIVHILFLISFEVYIFTLIEILFFSIPFIPSEIVAAREFSQPHLNLVPLRDILAEPISVIIRNLIGNIIIFIPLGFYIPIMLQEISKVRKTMTIIGCSAIGVELIQFIGSFLIFKLDWKVVDIDDVIMNVIGGIIGLICYQIAHGLTSHYSKSNKQLQIANPVSK